MSITISLPDRFLDLTPKDVRERKYLFDSCNLGIYVLFDIEGNVMYVGKSKNLRNRLLAHFRGNDVTDSYAGKIDKVRIYYVADALSRELYETYAINTLRPWLNTAKVYHEGTAILFEDEVAELEIIVRDLEEERATVLNPEHEGDYDLFDRPDTYKFSEDMRDLVEIENELVKYQAKLQRIKSQM